MAQIVPLIILIPALGAFINIFWGSRLKEDQSALVGIFASSGAFIIALLLYFNLLNTNYQEAIINPFFFDSWIRVIAADIEIPWQMRVDTLSVTMMLVITGVGTLIHVYARGYMHGDPLFSRFFAYLNMFLAFMLILVTGNNLLMLFVGWEGVGLMSYLLIGFWFSKPKGEGYQNANAARKAFIANRVGDFGLLMAMFLTFWTFGTLDFFKPGEVINPNYQTGAAFGSSYSDSYDDHGAEDDHSEEAVCEEQAAIPGTNFVLTSNL
ncbi:MAG: proton-conducting transporter membrane subunit, partial [Chloroflexota bacterium]